MTTLFFFFFWRFPVSVSVSHFYLNLLLLYLLTLSVQSWFHSQQVLVGVEPHPGKSLGVSFETLCWQDCSSSFISSRYSCIIGCSKTTPSQNCPFKTALPCLSVNICWLLWGPFLLPSGLSYAPLLFSVFAQTMLAPVYILRTVVYHVTSFSFKFLSRTLILLISFFNFMWWLEESQAFAATAHPPLIPRFSLTNKNGHLIWFTIKQAFERKKAYLKKWIWVSV